MKSEYVKCLSMVKNGGAKVFIVTCNFLRMVTFFIKI